MRTHSTTTADEMTLFKGAIGKDTVSRVWRRVKTTGEPGRSVRPARRTSSG